MVSLICALVLTTAAGACAHGPQVALVAPDGTPRAVVRVEIANTIRTRKYGLMFRPHLNDDAGMIFIFPAPQQLAFWMKNTEIPLDMVFADAAGKVVGIVQNAQPFSLRSLGVHADAQYVLEVNGGFARRHQVMPGDKLQFSGFVPQASE